MKKFEDYPPEHFGAFSEAVAKFEKQRKEWKETAIALTKKEQEREAQRQKSQAEFENKDLGELHSIRKQYDWKIKKLFMMEDKLEKTRAVLQHCLPLSARDDRPGLLVRLMEFRVFLVPSVPFYGWARDIVIKLPSVEAAVLSGHGERAIRSLLQEFIDLIHEANALREDSNRQAIEADRQLAKKTGQMMEKVEKAKKKTALRYEPPSVLRSVAKRPTEGEMERY